MQSKDITLFFHTDSVPKKDNPSHRHNDLTSFVLYYKGKPIIIDIGRFNYSIDDPIGSYGYSAKAHNCLTVDKLGPQAGINNRRLPDFYRSSKVTTDYSIDSKQFEFIIEHNGFCRIFGDPVKHTRTFKLCNGCFSLEDKLMGKKNHKIKTLFHWNHDLRLIKNDEGSFKVDNLNDQQFEGLFRCQNDGIYEGNFQSTLIKNNNNGMGYYFPNYGIKEEITTLVFSQDEKLPIVNKYSFEWNS